MNQIRQWLWRYKGRVAAGFVCLTIVDVATLFVPLVLSDAIDRLTAGDGNLLVSGLLIVALAVVAFVFRYFWRLFLIGTSRRIERDLRARLYDHLLSLPASFYNETKTGDLMAHATNDIEAVTFACGFGLITILDPLVMIPFSVGVMLSINVRMTAYAVLPLPILTIVMLAFGRVIHARFEFVQAAFSATMEKVRENVSGIPVLKAFVQEEGSERDFARTNQTLADRNMSLVRVHGLFHVLIELLAGATLALTLWIGGGSVIRGAVSLGNFVAFSQYLSMLIWPMIALGDAVNIFQRGRASLGRIGVLLAVRPTIAEPESPRAMNGTRIEIRDLTFTYPAAGAAAPALRDIDLTLEEGTTLGIVGMTGSGKSTLAHLIPRVFDPPPGAVRIGGVDVRDVSLADLRKTMGFVPQDAFLFSATIAENIAFGRPDASRDKIERAAQLAGIHDEILAFPDGYETRVGERGLSLSGGQKQRVAIARALLLEPQVVIFDDPLSAVDAEREEFILANLREFFRGRTSILIAHRISAVRNADRIIVLDEGRIVDSGRHEELAAREGIYRRIWTLQQAERRTVTG
ncbi:MAG: ABC transporter ATP-binding protein [Candidatus Bipolaricaulota bacterium]|nr:ABC transporter ATP-binding protein [Candidatus Bipolaricaulota bacterium]